MKYFVRHINTHSMSAVISDTKNDFYILHPPYDQLKRQKCLSKLPHYKLSKALTLSEINEEVETLVLMNSLFLMYDFFIIVNEGSIDIRDDIHYKELLINKLINNAFVFKGEARKTALQWLNLSFIVIDYKPHDIDEICDELEDKGIDPSLVRQIYDLKLFPDKYSLVNRLLDVELDKFKPKNKWLLVRKICFVILFMANNFNNSRITDSKEAFKDATDEFERTTGMDPNYSRFHRASDRTSAMRHQEEAKRKLDSGD